ncbi:MAG: SUMF1/EgtB/PvdO family nonheme iron enzyme [bacterium]|nr:SUMF1/EgtB/PvdO family nonheme iron enzyme [bacterium]
MKRDAEDLLAEWLERLDAEEGGDFEDLLRRHPEQAAELERLYGYWRKLQSIDRRVQPEELEEPAPSSGKAGRKNPFRGPASLGPEGAGLTPRMRLGQFELIEELGRGGMGVVWRARDLMLGEEVALKFLPHVLAADRLSMLRLRREAKVLLSLTHLHIVRLRTVAVKHGLTFLVEECLDGPTLDHLAQDRIEAGERGLTPEEAVWILSEIAPALDYAHGEGVTHRDLKPSNLMLDAPPGDELGAGGERAKLTDFGLAFVATSALTQISGYRPSGTLPFMAPEVLIGRKPTPAADLYSLGATLYALVAGRPPFTHGDVATQVLHRRPDPLESGDGQLDAAVAAAMAKNPAERPATAGDLLAIATGEAHAPRKPRRVAALVAAVAALALVTLAIAFFVGGPDDDETSSRRDEGLGLQAAASPRDAEPPTPSAGPGPRLILEAPYDVAGGTRVYIGEDAGGLVLRGRVTDARDNRIDVYVDSLHLMGELDDDGAFVLPTLLVPGHVYSVRALAAGVEPRAFEVMLDTEPPQLTLLEPAETSRTNESSIRVRVRVEDTHVASVEVAGTALRDAGAGVWETSDLPLEPGTNRLEVRATDGARQTAQLEFRVVRRSIGPRLVEVAPKRHAPLALGTRTFVALTFSAPIDTATLDGRSMTVDAEGRTARITVVPRELGPARFNWSAIDRAGTISHGQVEYPIELLARSVELDGRMFENLAATQDRDTAIGWQRWPRRIRDPRTGIVFRLVDPGAYERGSREGRGRFDELPRHERRVARPFYLAETEVTRGAWRAFAERTEFRTQAERRGTSLTRAPGAASWHASAAAWDDPIPAYPFDADDTHPVTQISWLDARAYCAEHGYRLPTEAEWEYACRAGGPGQYPWGDTIERAPGNGNFRDATLARVMRDAPGFEHDDGHAFTAPVGTSAPNAFGLYDMLGNVWEWCEDAYDPTAYARADQVPFRPIEGAAPRVLRGGSWLTDAEGVRCARRAWDDPNSASDVRGFRVTFSPEMPPLQAAALRADTPPTAETRALHDETGTKRVEWIAVRDLEGNGAFDGKYTSWYADGAVAVEGRFERERRRRRWTGYFPNGDKQWTGIFRDDQREGEWIFYDPNGTTLASGEYERGWRTGSWGSSEYSHVDDATGRGELLAGKRHGPWIERGPEGRVRFIGSYVRGKRVEAWRFYHADGTYDPLMLSGSYVAGRKVADASPPWRPTTSDYTPPAVAPRATRQVARLFAIDGDPLGLTSADFEAPSPSRWVAQMRERLDTGPDSGVIASLVASLFACDLSDAEHVGRAEFALALLENLAGGRSLSWRTGTSNADVAHNGMQRLRLAELWRRTAGEPLFWELEVALPPELQRAHPILSDLAEDEREVHTRRDDPVLMNPLDYRAIPARAAVKPRGRRVVTGAAQIENELGLALDWLEAHQFPEGYWGAEGFTGMCSEAGHSVCDGEGNGQHDVGVTGLALLALHRAGGSLLGGERSQTLRAGVGWLLLQQDDLGRFGGAEAPPPDTAVPRSKARTTPHRFPPTTRVCETCGGDGMRVVAGHSLLCGPCNGTGSVTTPGGQVPQVPQTPGTDDQPASAGTANAYDHAIATLALAEMLASTPTPSLERAVRAAVGFIERSRNPYGAWRYSMTPNGDNDTSISCWNMLALIAAREAGITFDSEVYVGFLNWLDEVTDSSNMRVGYDTMGSPSARIVGINDHHAEHFGEALTAQALLVRLRLGRRDTRPRQFVERQADLLVKDPPPHWGASDLRMDMYYWMFGTDALRRVGGRHWKAWSNALLKSLANAQRRDGGYKGSWDPVGPWGPIGGRVYSTAMMALVNETRLRE